MFRMQADAALTPSGVWGLGFRVTGVHGGFQGTPFVIP